MGLGGITGHVDDHARTARFHQRVEGAAHIDVSEDFQIPRHVSSSMSRSFPPGMAPALFTRMSVCGNSAASRTTLRLSDRSAATGSIRILAALRAIDSFAAARSTAVRDTRITLQPSSARASAAARPMPLEAPVINAVFPTNLRSIRDIHDRGGRY